MILGDSRLAHFDDALISQVSGEAWQNLAFGGASLKETNDLLEYVLDNDPHLQQVLFGLSFYTLSANYNTDRMGALEDTLHNPFAYCLNLEYNINALTNFSDMLAGRGDVEETGDWQYPHTPMPTARCMRYTPCWRCIPKPFWAAAKTTA